MGAHLIKRPGRSNWYIKDGERRISCKTTRKGYAEELLQEYIRKDLGIVRPSSKKVSTFVDDYIAQAETVNKKTTVDDKRRTLRFFCELSDLPVSRICRETVWNYLVNRRERGISNERWNTERQVLSNFFRFLIAKGVLRENPAIPIQKQKIVRNKHPKALSPDQEQIILTWLEENDREGSRIAVLAGNTGLRARELVYLDWADVDWKGRYLHVRAKDGWTPKDYEERAIPLNGVALRLLKEQRRFCLGSPHVFPRIDGGRYGRGLDLRICRHFKRAGLGSGGLHTMRHTYATRMVEAGCDLESLRKLMGHSDTKTLGRYLHVGGAHVRKMSERVQFGNTGPNRAQRRKSSGG